MMKCPGKLEGENLLTYEHPMSSFRRPEREVQRMPLLFCSPFIIWTGLFEVAREETRSLPKSGVTVRLGNDRTR
jgi:hypothetical protein